MAVPFATFGDVQARWRSLSAAEQLLADQLAVDASAMLRERWSDVDDRITAGTLEADSVTRIVALAVKRAMIAGNHEGVESHTEGAGPFSFSDKYANPLANLYFTAADVLLLDGNGFSARSRTGWLA